MNVGNIVRIVNPEVFVRAGYEETLESATQKMNQEVYNATGQDAHAVLKSTFPFLFSCEKLVEELGMQYNRNVLKFGGNKRTIHTEHVPELQFKFAKILERILKHSGTYEASGGWDEPAYIKDRKCHVMYRLAILDDTTPSRVTTTTYLYPPTQWTLGQMSVMDSGKPIIIERMNLEFVTSS